jgi:hypothetical protein
MVKVRMRYQQIVYFRGIETEQVIVPFLFASLKHSAVDKYRWPTFDLEEVAGAGNDLRCPV